MRFYDCGNGFFITIGRVNRAGSIVAQRFNLGANVKRARDRAAKLTELWKSRNTAGDIWNDEVTR